MKLGVDRYMPLTACLGCGKRIDGATHVGEEDSFPDTGSITVCIYCGHIQAYDDDLRLRELTSEEQIDIAGDPRILAIQRARALAEEKREKEMSPNQYRSARRTLGWSHPKLAEVIGKSERESYRYSNGAVEIPETVGKLLRRLVRDRLTLSERKFEETVAQL